MSTKQSAHSPHPAFEKVIAAILSGGGTIAIDVGEEQEATAPKTEKPEKQPVTIATAVNKLRAERGYGAEDADEKEREGVAEHIGHLYLELLEQAENLRTAQRRVARAIEETVSAGNKELRLDELCDMRDRIRFALDDIR